MRLVREHMLGLTTRPSLYRRLPRRAFHSVRNSIPADMTNVPDRCFASYLTAMGVLRGHGFRLEDQS
jgi:hypothetical protein